MNLLFVTADQLRADCLSSTGHSLIKTPHLDRLASQGVQFLNHFCQATPCSPSRTSMHFGQYLFNHRVVVNGVGLDQTRSRANWAKSLGAAGYDPHVFGYTDTGTDHRQVDDSNDPRLRHYSEFIEGITPFTRYAHEAPIKWIESLQNKGYPVPDDYWQVYSLKANGKEWGEGGDIPLPSLISLADHETHFLVSACEEMIRQKKYEPWAIHLSLLRPHPPFVAPKPYNRLYDPDDVEMPHRLATSDEEGRQHPWLSFHLQASHARAPADEATFRRLKAGYYGLINEVDDALGHLFGALRETDQWDDTMIIVTSDHGEQMGDHWMWGKAGYFDSSYHIPLIVRDPRSTADGTRGHTFQQFTENVDLMPTILEAFDLDIPTQCDGHSLRPFIETGNAPEAWRTEVHWEYDFRDPINLRTQKELGLSQHQCGLCVLRDEAYKYVHFTTLPALLFDLKQDPHEFENRANDPAYRDVMLHYTQKMLSWRMNHTDRSLTETFLSADGPVERREALVN